MSRRFTLGCLVLVGLGGAALLAGEVHLERYTAGGRYSGGYRLKHTDLSKRILWGAPCEAPDGTGLLFGGQDQDAPDGNPHTQIKQAGGWVSIYKELREKNPLQRFQERVWTLRNLQKNAAAKARFIYLKGLPSAETAKRMQTEWLPMQDRAAKGLAGLLEELKGKTKDLAGYEAGQAKYAIGYLEETLARMRAILKDVASNLRPQDIAEMRSAQVALEKASEVLDAEPPPRALSPLAYDAKTGLFVIFGGDHQDYLTNDTWVFDPAKRKWMQRRPKSAPPPRTNHLLKTAGDGKVTLSEGCSYAENETFSYHVQYRDSADGIWTYDLEADAWSGGVGVSPDARTYRPKTFLPEYCLGGPKPNAATQEARLRSIPVNTWVDMNAPKRPPGGRGWGTVVLDPDRDVILRWAGGHSDYCGTDVIHYHLSTNRWEMPFPAENPMGETAMSGPHPSGVNFNLRPAMIGHTYKSYAYDLVSKKMVFAGRPSAYGRKPEQQDVSYYVYDPEVADWTDKGPKHPAMFYDSCMHDLTLCGTPQGTFAWNRRGMFFGYVPSKKKWGEVKLTGTPLPGATCDGASLSYDSKRNRLLAIRTPKLDAKYDGEVYEIDLKTFAVRALAPAGMKALASLTYIRETAYDSANDAMLVAEAFPRGGAGGVRLPVYDCANNRWVAVKIAGPDLFFGKYPFFILAGLVYDAKRGLHWAVGGGGCAYALRLDLKAANPQVLGE